MDAHARRALAVDLLEREGRVAVADLTARTGASDMTIRRDLQALEHEGCARRVHGGAISVVSSSYEAPYAVRATARRDEKRAIGRRAAALLDPGGTVLLDGGTTAMEVGRHLTSRAPLTVCTLGLQAAAALAEAPGIRLLVPGGEPRTGEGMFTGELTRRSLRDLRFDTYVMAVGGIGAAGVSDFHLDDVAVKRIAIGCARRVLVVADGTKVGAAAFARIAEATTVDVLVTDASAPADELERLRDVGITVEIA